MFTGFNADTRKMVESETLDVITQNYVQPFTKSLKTIDEKIVLKSKEFTTRGTLAFSTPKRGL